MTAAEMLRGMRVEFDGLDVCVNQDGALVLSKSQADAMIALCEAVGEHQDHPSVERTYAAFESSLKETRP